jgi:tetratricopeptide (TPR) repeat protein
MKLLLKILTALALIGLMLYCFQLVKLENAKIPTDDGLGGPNQSLIVSLYGAVMLIGAGLAVLFALTIVPFFAEQAAGLVYGSAEKIEKGPHAEALSRAAQGDYEGAIEAYEKVIEHHDPDDTLALSEIAHLYADKLNDPEFAAQRLATALERDWKTDKAAFLTFRLADLYWKTLGDYPAARVLLEQIIERMPGSTHSANAMHRVREIDTLEREAQEAEFLASGQEPDAENAIEESARGESEDEQRPT